MFWIILVLGLIIYYFLNLEYKKLLEKRTNFIKENLNETFANRLLILDKYKNEFYDVNEKQNLRTTLEFEFLEERLIKHEKEFTEIKEMKELYIRLEEKYKSDKKTWKSIFHDFLNYAINIFQIEHNIKSLDYIDSDLIDWDEHEELLIKNEEIVKRIKTF